MSRWTQRALHWLLGICLTAATSTLSAAVSERYTATSQVGAFAPNAGGQQAYSLRLGKGDWEAGIFSNQYVMAGDYPLTGAVVDRRFAVCGADCFWQFFVQFGAGGSSGGPVAEITWGSIIPLLPIWLPRSAPSYVPALRLDITTQIILVRYRAVTWSYPLWVGLSLPL